MTAVEHIVAWIESSLPHYERLKQLERNRALLGNTTSARVALELVLSAYNEAVRGRDMYARDQSPETLLDAAKALLVWELET